MSRLAFGRRLLACGCLLLVLLLAVAASGQRAPVSVRSVDFNEAHLPALESPFYEIVITLRGERTEAVSGLSALHPNIEVRLELAFAQDGNPVRWQCYRSRARLVGLAPGDEKRVYFYLPPEIAARDRLQRAPAAWRVALTVDGQVLPHLERSYSSNLQQPAAAQRFLAEIQRQAPRNDGLLLPIYLTAFYDGRSRRMAHSPSYIRNPVSTPSENSPSPLVPD